ncbi:MAG: 16S rRNA (cytidine(1402)-2'-O)-methyltransferase [Flavobacteriales bacterium]|nr:16S rRNA (cytidine(1402)-2'-O)-methyltransferase [Flavobacteriales bacterium]
MSRLVLVPTPIGNLEDITLRAIRILKECDFILAEDTRESRKLLQHLGIEKAMHSYHQNNEHKILDSLVQRIEISQMVALITDAGTPAISDPGYLLVRACLQAGIEVECLPGPVAFVPALVNSGLPSEKFIFEGFLPHKKGRETRMKAIAAENRTVILYESPHRLIKTLELIRKFCGDQRPVSVSRELTKKFEETVRGSCLDVLTHFLKHEPRGEFVVVIGAASLSLDVEIEE